MDSKWNQAIKFVPFPSLNFQVATSQPVVMNQLRNTPLTLQDQCFLYLICHLPLFPTNALALLPRHIRYKLVINLPAVDISRLEGSSFFCPTGRKSDAIDSDEVWKDVFNSRMIMSSCQWPMHRYFDDRQFLGKWKDHYFMRIFTALLNGSSGSTQRTHREYVYALLLSVKDCLGVFKHMKQMAATSYRVDPSTKSIVPAHYVRIQDATYSDVVLLKLIMQECCYRPKELHIICNLFSQMDIWSQKDSATNAVLKDSLSCVEELKLSSYSFGMIEGDLSFMIPQFLLETIVACGNKQFRNIIIDAAVPVVEGILMRIAPLFHNNVYQFRYYPTPSSLPYTNLEQVAISTDSPFSQLSRSIYLQLALILQNQPRLQYVHLDGPFLSEQTNSSLGTKQFLSALTGFVMGSRYSRLTLELRSTSLAVIKQLLGSFLLSPSEQVMQRFIMHEFSVLPNSESFPLDIPQQITMADSALDRKLLHFRYMNSAFPVLSWLGEQPCLRLSSLEVSSLSEEIDVVGMVARHRDFRIKQLNLSAKFPRSPSIQQDMEIILQKPELLTFDLYDCMHSGSISDSSLLMAVTHGLLQQAKLGRLYQLSFEKNRLGRHSKAALQLFFDAVFSFPRLDQLGVNLSNNGFEAHHSMLLYDAWKAKSGGKQRLRRLDYRNNVLPEDSWYLEQIASIFNSIVPTLVQPSS